MIGPAETLGGATSYQLKITLDGFKPPIWRRVTVPGTIPLSRLHQVIQVAMGWEDDHLHLFRTEKKNYGPPDHDVSGTEGNEAKVSLSMIAPKVRSKFLYDYDFGDSWQHTILVEKIMPNEPLEKHAVCLDGARACPPEDCGGVPGYWNLLEVIKKPDHPDYENLMEWVGPDWDPEEFNLKGINSHLKKLKI